MSGISFTKGVGVSPFPPYPARPCSAAGTRRAGSNCRGSCATKEHSPSARFWPGLPCRRSHGHAAVPKALGSAARSLRPAADVAVRAGESGAARKVAQRCGCRAGLALRERTFP